MRQGEARAAHRAGRGVVVAVVGALVAMPSVASADPGPPWSVSHATPLLGGDETLGVFSFEDHQTDGFRGSGPCPTGDDPDGYAHAAVFRGATSVASRLTLTVEDDLGSSPSLCRVSVYGAALLDPFDEAERDAHRLDSSTACATASSCDLTVQLPASTTFYVALWAAHPDAGEDDEARFSLDGGLKRPISMRLGISGHRIRERCAGWYEVVKGRLITIQGRASAAIAGSVRIRWYESRNGSWQLLGTYIRPLEGGAVKVVKRAGTGRRLVKVNLVENDGAYPANTPYARFKLIVPKARYYSDGGMRLTVRYYRQQHRLSCEAATVRMAHNYFHPGRIDRDVDVYKITGWDKKRRPRRTGGCNPDRAFCGNVNGYMMRDGYGVHAGPVARGTAVYDRCRPGLLLKDYSMTAIAKQIRNGYPVIVWGAHRGASGIYRYRWRAYDGHRVTAWSVEHTWTVIGYRGSASRPTHFIIHDPSQGASKTMSRSRFRAFTKYFETAVVVRG